MINEYKDSKEALEKLKISFFEIEKTSKFRERSENDSQKRIFDSQMRSLEKKFMGLVSEFKVLIGRIDFSKPLDPDEIERKLGEVSESLDAERKVMTKGGKLFTLKEILPNDLENETVKRIRKKRKESDKEKHEKKKKDSSYYTKISSRFFSKVSLKLLSQDSFSKMEQELIKANLNYTPVGYVSIILMTTFLSVFVAGFLFLFFLFFNFTSTLPIISRVMEPIDARFLKTFWILIVVPITTFAFMYIYPSLEKESASNAINSELPFATISMSAIAGSMMSPDRIFKILISTNEYPALKKEFTKMVNEINLYGYDLVSALKNTSKNSPSKELSELLNGLATTITSGGDLSEFFDERAETLLFNYRISQERASRTAETFMDIYISILIAAPMILMLLLIIMKISGLGVSMSFLAISLLISLVVAVVNVIFLAFLQMRRNKQ
ncbi:type II secretion system F family protein [Candidatus Pacearchaeota archaeon]|nr:type II secretion system F family protein [Candidatus Pacearchaeota archaeon]